MPAREQRPRLLASLRSIASVARSSRIVGDRVICGRDGELGKLLLRAEKHLWLLLARPAEDAAPGLPSTRRALLMSYIRRHRLLEQAGRATIYCGGRLTYAVFVPTGGSGWWRCAHCRRKVNVAAWTGTV